MKTFCSCVLFTSHLSPFVVMLGNEELVKNADKFWWFGHIWNHYQPHSQNKENIIDLMRQNYEFAEVSSMSLY